VSAGRAKRADQPTQGQQKETALTDDHNGASAAARTTQDEVCGGQNDGAVRWLSSDRKAQSPCSHGMRSSRSAPVMFPLVPRPLCADGSHQCTVRPGRFDKALIDVRVHRGL
jgi:hypothetical protein